VATTVVTISAQLKVTFMANILVPWCELEIHSQNFALTQFSTVCIYKYYGAKTLCQLLTLQQMQSSRQTELHINQSQ